MVERLRTLWSSPLKGDGGLSLLVEHLKVLISRACLRIQFTYWVGGLMVEHLKVLNSRACLRILMVER